MARFFLGFRVKPVTIEPTADTLGHTEYWSRPALWANFDEQTSEPPLSRKRLARALERLATCLGQASGRPGAPGPGRAGQDLFWAS